MSIKSAPDEIPSAEPVFVQLARLLGYQLLPGAIEYLASFNRETAQYLEYRLDDVDQPLPIDHLFCVNRQGVYFNHPILAQCTGVMTNLRRRFESIPYFWFEYDDLMSFPTDSPAKKALGMHVCVKPDYLHDGVQTADFNPQQVADVLSCLATNPLAEVDELIALITTCQQYGQLIHVSLMRGRTPQSIKLFIKVKQEKLITLLGALKWPGDIASAHKLLVMPWHKPQSDGNVSIDLKIDLNLSGQKVEPLLTGYIALVSSKMHLGGNTDGPLRVAALMERDVIHRDEQINAVMAWLKPQNHYDLFRWLDVKSLIDERGVVSYKLYFGMQDTLKAQAKKVLASKPLANKDQRPKAKS